jgi:invasion protein IalB
MTLRLIAALLLAPSLALAQATPPAPARSAPAPAPAPNRPAAPVATPAPAAEPAAERAWSVTCTEAAAPGAARDCRLSTSAILRPQNQRLAQVILARQPETRSLGLVFQAPHGVLLPSGLAWQVDEGEVQRIPFTTSDADGVYAGVPLADDLLAALRRGATLKITFVVAARREALTVPVPLTQFSEAVAEFFAAERAAATPTPPPAPAAAPRR